MTSSATPRMRYDAVVFWRNELTKWVMFLGLIGTVLLGVSRFFSASPTLSLAALTCLPLATVIVSWLNQKGIVSHFAEFITLGLFLTIAPFIVGMTIFFLTTTEDSSRKLLMTINCIVWLMMLGYLPCILVIKILSLHINPEAHSPTQSQE